jgi:ABC-2 type transport system permease protein
VVKEIKEMIRDPKILLGMVLMPLIMFPVMGAAMSISQTAVEESLKEVSMALMDLDQGPMARNLIQSFDALNVTLMEMEAPSLDEALELLQGSNITTLVVIPSGFSQNLTLGFRGELEIYSVIKSISLSEGAKASVANAPIGAYENLLVYQAIKQAIPDRSPETVLDPIALHSFVIFKGRLVEAPPGVLTGLFMSQSFAFPMVIMLLLISAMQMAATSVAIEKEEKTLETLLTLPVSRLSILAGKLGGSVVVAAAGAIAALIGVNYYTSSIFRSVAMESLDMEALGFALSPTAYVLLGVTMFVTIISALALAICLSVFSENVRSAQAVVSFTIIPVVVPSLILMFADIEILPFAVQAIMYILPYTHSIIASKAAFMGDYFIMLRSIAYISLFTIVILYIAAKIFTTEKIVTARISFKKLGIKRFLARQSGKD